MYKERRRVLDGDDMKESVLGMMKETVANHVYQVISDELPPEEWDLTAHYFATGQLKFDKGFIYKMVPMSQAQEAFQMFKTPGLVQGKVMLVNED